MNKYRWIEAAVPAEAAEAGGDAARALELPAAAGRFLAARGLTQTDAVRAYLSPSADLCHDPFAFANMKEAVELVESAVRTRSAILVHGDYDVDGIAGTALLYHYLNGLVPDVYRFVPDRRRDGYGISSRAIEWAMEKKVGLFIAVDCGTSDAELIGKLEASGIPAIVCDHHQFPVEGGSAGVMLNPVREGETYPFASLCGAGVAFKLVEALDRSGVRGAHAPESLLDLVALATVGDVAPLVGENRYYVQRGLALINSAPRPGVAAMKGLSRLGRDPVSARHIAFGLAPRINAPGRVSHAKPSLEILCEAEGSRAMQLASILESENERRKEMTRRVHEDAVQRIKEMDDAVARGGYVLADPSWDQGVLGIAAARVAEEFNRPAILMNITGDVAKGSGRSVPGIDLKRALDQFHECFVRYGGHAQAVGLTMTRENIERFSNGFSDRLREFVTPGTGLPLRIDSWLEIEECATMDLPTFLARCEPFGADNAEPVWKIADIQVTDKTCLVGDGHLKLFFQDTRGFSNSAIAFGWDRPFGPEDLHGRVVDIAVRVRRGSYMGETYAELRLVDIRAHGEGDD